MLYRCSLTFRDITLLYVSAIIFILLQGISMYKDVRGVFIQLSHNQMVQYHQSSVTSWTFFRPRLNCLFKVFQVVLVPPLHNSAFLLPSRCCPILLQIAANLIFIFLVSSCQPVLHPALPRFLHFFRCQEVCTRLFF